jgi:hypothetical protein
MFAFVRTFGLRDVFVGASSLVVLAVGACSECRTDQDCAGRGESADLLCVDGDCTEGTPDEVAPVSCQRNADCDDGDVCFGDVCVVVPTCQQLVGNFVARRGSAGGFGEVAATTDGCEIRFTGDVGGTTVNVSVAGIADDGALIDPVGFDGGNWNPAARVGTLDNVNGQTIVFGTTDFACREGSDCGDQVAHTCRTACAGGDGCDGACDADGFCKAASRGTCR